MLRVLGKTQFGIWAIAGVVTSYAQLSEMGMNTAILKYVAEHWSKKEINRISNIVSTALFSFAIIGGIVVLTILLTCNFIVASILNVSPDLQDEVIFVIKWVIIIFYFNIVFSVFNSILQGIQRMDVTNVIVVSSKILNALSLYAFLSAGFGLKGLVLNSALISFLTITSNVFYAKRLVKGLKINPFRVSYYEFRRIIKYSLNIFVANLMGLGQEPINKIILSAYTSLSSVTFYEIGCRVRHMAGQLFSIGIMPLLPASSDLHGANRKHEMEQLFLSIARKLYIYAMPFYLIGIVLAEPLVQVWLGDGYKMAAQAIQFLLLGSLLSLLVTPHYLILQGIGKPHLSTVISGINGLANIIIAILLVRLIGFHGVLVSLLSSVLLAAIATIYLFHRATGFHFSTYIRSLPLRTIVTWCAVTAVLLFFVSAAEYHGLTTLLLVGIGFLIFYVSVISMHMKKDGINMITKLKQVLSNRDK
jgi:O-antigen/teichoic acid export membrane protein